MDSLITLGTISKNFSLTPRIINHRWQYNHKRKNVLSDPYATENFVTLNSNIITYLNKILLLHKASIIADIMSNYKTRDEILLNRLPEQRWFQRYEVLKSCSLGNRKPTLYQPITAPGIPLIEAQHHTVHKNVFQSLTGEIHYIVFKLW